MEENTFGILIDKIFSICGVCSHTQWTNEVFQLFFDFPIGSFASPYTKTCRIEVRSDQNVMYHFLDNYEFPTTPSIKWLDDFLKQREIILSNWIDKGWCYEHPPAYLQNLLTWIFFNIIRRTFDFNVFLKEKEAKNLEEMYSVQPDKFHLWELITNLISKTWFFKLIIELKIKSKKYVSIIDNLIEHKKLNIGSTPLMDQILSEMKRKETYLGFPVYASEGEIVIIRKFEQNEISNRFVDRAQNWFIVLQEILKRHGYVLTYHDPYGSEIDHFPIEICLSFKSEKFKGNRMPVFFTPKFDSLFKKI